MPTTITKTIKTAGGDYTSIAAWEAGQQGDLVAGDTLQVGELYALQETGLVTIDGSVTDATRYMKLTVHSSARHAGLYDPSGGKFSWVSGTSGTLLNISDDFFRAEFLQMAATNAVNGKCIAINNPGCIISESILTKAGGNPCLSVAGVASINAIIRNCVIYGGSSNGITITEGGSGCEVDNCTLVANTGMGVQSGATTDVTVKNTYAGGNSIEDMRKGGVGACTGWTFATCASSDATTRSNTTPSIPHSTTTFVSVTGGSEDYHLAQGSALIDVGTDLSGSFTIDAVGAIRTVPWDLGALQFAPSGPTVPFFTIVGARFL